VASVALSPDGHRLASGSRDKTVRLWNPDTGQPIGAPLTGHTDAVNSVAFSPDGNRLASGSQDYRVQLWDADSGQRIGQPLAGHTDFVETVAFSPDGQLLASGDDDDDEMIRVWPGYATPEMLCDKLSTNMSQKQWHDWLFPDPHISYSELCQGLPPARD